MALTKKWVRAAAARLASAAVVLSLLAAVGCGAFFKCEGKTSCGATGGVTNTGDVVFASNQASTNVYAYYVGSDGTLNAVSGEPFSVPFAPVSMAVTPDNSLLYVSTANGIYSYTVSSTGVLSNVTARSTTTLGAASMAVAPNGKWVLTLDQVNVSSVPLLRAYSIDAGGALGSVASSASMTSTLLITPGQVAVSPSGKYVAAAMGNAGTYVWQFDQTAATSNGQGTLTYLYNVGVGSATTGDQSVTFDKSDNMYVARSGSSTGIDVYSIGTGTYKLLSPAGGPYATGSSPRSLAFTPGSSSYLYSANTVSGSISAFGDASATLTSIGTTTTVPSGVAALAVDSSGSFVLAAGTSYSAGLQIFAIGTSGGLTAGKTAELGTSNATPILAVTH